MIRTLTDVTPAVLAVMEQTPDPRLRRIMVSLIKHLHGFILETRLTEEEFQAATAIINEIGQASSDSHNEAVLMAGSLGVSTLVCLLNNGDGGRTETTQNLLGPFWRLNQPRAAGGDSIVRSGTPGDPCLITLDLVDVDGDPVAGADVDVWQASPAGRYENQDPAQADHNLRARFTSDESGRIWFWSVRPSGYPIPTDTVVGRLLAAQNRHPYRPAHIHALAYKPGFKTLITQIYDGDDPHLETDVQFGVTRALLGRFEGHSEAHPSRPDHPRWFSLSHRLVMEPGLATMPSPPIR